MQEILKNTEELKNNLIGLDIISNIFNFIQTTKNTSYVAVDDHLDVCHTDSGGHSDCVSK